MSKKFKTILIIIAAVISTVLVVIYFFLPKKGPTIAPTPSPSASVSPLPTIPSSELPDDTKYSQALTNLSKQYPWYSKLPIETAEYRIIYDFNKKSFRIRLKVGVSSDQVNAIIQNALADLKDIGVASPINYYVLDVNGNQL